MNESTLQNFLSGYFDNGFFGIFFHGERLKRKKVDSKSVLAKDCFLERCGAEKEWRAMKRSVTERSASRLKETVSLSELLQGSF